ncbi:MAG: glycosyltransferase family 9 protein [Candidatus Cloacimonetes bacterium]|nr:glycosyltransferase family 9 protein [Candidatus Cloacimonadota bacterium]
MKPADVKQIALMQLKAIGDTLMCEPSITAIRETYPQAEITFITSDVAYEILRYHPGIDHFIIWKKKTPLLPYLGFLWRLGRLRFDLLIDFHKNPRSHQFAMLIRAATKISFRSARRNLGYNVLLPEYALDTYVPIEKLRLANHILPKPAELTIPKVYFADIHRHAADAIFAHQGLQKSDIVMIVSPISKVSQRLWKAPNFARLCDFILQNYPVKILFTWGPGEKHIVDEVKRLMQEASPSIDYKIDSLHTLAALYEKADLWVGNDSGPRHLAIGAGLPTFTPFGHFWHRHWTPPDTDAHVCVEPDNRDPKLVCDRIDTLSYEKVEAACREWMNSMMQRIGN